MLAPVEAVAHSAAVCSHSPVARSIHATHSTPSDLRDEEDLERKSLIKRLVAEERGRPRAPTPTVASHAIPVSVRDRGPYVHYPASPDDVRAVLSRLPAGIAQGIGGIEFAIDEAPTEFEATTDPFVGRLQNEFVPGIFGSAVLGRYRPNGSVLQLFGYAYDSSRPDCEIVELYLRLKMLSTFAHEVAHHDDFSARTGRRQWRAEDSYGREVYAEAMEYAWTQDYVVPYLEEAYPTQVAELQRWIEVYGGISLSLGVLAGDPRTTGGIDGERLFFSVDSAFESLLSMVARGETPPATQVEFAKQLHYGHNYEDALSILAHVTREHPGNVAALVLRGDIFLHQDRVDEAGELAQALVGTKEADADVWELVCDVARVRGDWPGVLAATEHLLASAGPPAWWVGSKRALQVRALIEVGDLDRAEATLANLCKGSAVPAWRKREQEALRCLLLLRREKYEEALALSVALLGDWPEHAVLLAIRVEAAHHLHRMSEGGELYEWACARLRRMGYGAWVDRLSGLLH